MEGLQRRRFCSDLSIYRMNVVLHPAVRDTSMLDEFLEDSFLDCYAYAALDD